MRRSDDAAVVQVDTAASRVLALRSRRDQVDSHPDLVRHAHDAERHRWGGHTEVAELPAGTRRRGGGEIAAIALGDDVKGDLLGLSADGHVADEREGKATARREGQRQPADLCRDELRLWELPDLQGVLLDEVVTIALIARERGDVEADLRSRGERAIGVEIERPGR